MQESKKTLTFIEQNIFFFILFGIMLCGILIGTIVFCNFSDASADKLSFLAQGYLASRAEDGAFKILWSTFFNSSLLLFVTFLLGFSAVSQPIELTVPFFKGLGLGATVAQIYSISGAKGFIIVLLLVIPSAAITSIVLLLAVKDAVRFSNKLSHIACSTAFVTGMRDTTKNYCNRFFMLEAVTAIGALLDCLCTMLFAGILLK